MNFILFYSVLFMLVRRRYLKPYYFRRLSAFKLVQLLCSQSTKELCSLAKYIKTAFSVKDINI